MDNGSNNKNADDIWSDCPAVNQSGTGKPADLRFGIICSLYYRHVLKRRSLPRQIELLDEFFPGLAVRKAEAEQGPSAVYSDLDRMIYAPEKNGRFHINARDSRRVTQILGRLSGTARGSQEKERAAALAMQKRMAHDLCHFPKVMKDYRDLNTARIELLTTEQAGRFADVFAGYINQLIIQRQVMSEEEKETEPFPIQDEVFDEVMHNIIYQWNLEGNEKTKDPDVTVTDDLETTANAFTWLVLLSLLRNECGRLNTVYLSTFQPRSAYDQPEPNIEYILTDDPQLDGKEEDFYTGNDLDKRFPGIEWFCDRCGEYLNIQPGFDDHLRTWRCQKCGYENRISVERIYDTDKAFQNGQPPVNKDAFFQALKKRSHENES